MLTAITPTTATNLQFNMFVLSTGYELGVGPTGILGATKGDGTFSAVPEMRTPELNGLPKNTKAFQVIDSWTASVKAGAVEMTEAGLLFAAMYATSSQPVTDVTKITPAQGLIPGSYYSDIWISGDTSDGKLCAICLKNAINTSGITISFKDKGEGQYDLEIHANYEVGKLDTPPFELYLDKSYGTADPLTLEGITPAAGASGPVAKVEMTFNNAIASHAVSVVVASSGAVVPGTFAFDGTHKVLKFTPSGAFASALHIVNIAGVKDIYGQTLDTTTSTFTAS